MAIVAACAAVLMFLTAVAAARPAAALQVDVTQGNIQPLPIAIPDFLGRSRAMRQRASISPEWCAPIWSAPAFSGRSIQARFVDQITDINVPPNFANWRVINAQALVTGQVTAQPDGRLRVDFRLWDVYGESQMLGLQYFTAPENWRRIAHMVSDAIYERITGEKGYFDTRIVFISESGPAINRRSSGWRSWMRMAPIRSS